jgi:signal peptidase I
VVAPPEPDEPVTVVDDAAADVPPVDAVVEPSGDAVAEPLGDGVVEPSGGAAEVSANTAEDPAGEQELAATADAAVPEPTPVDGPTPEDPAEPVDAAVPEDAAEAEGVAAPEDAAVPEDAVAPENAAVPVEPETPEAAAVAMADVAPVADSAPIGGEVPDQSGDDQPAPDQHAGRVRHWREQSRKRNARAKRPWWIELPILIVIAFVLTFLIQTFVARVYYVPSGSMEHTLHGTTSGGDRILAFKMLYDFRDPEQGEVVVFKGPATWTPEANIPGPSTWIGKAAQALGSVVGIAPPNEKDYVKRVIAVGGQTIRCCDAKGRVQVNGTSLNEPYLFMEHGNPIYAQWEWIKGQDSCDVDPEDPTRYRSIRCFGPYTVPKGTVWVMGDHRPDSADSSYNCRGLVPSSRVHCQGPIPIDDVIGKAVAIVMPPSRWGSVGSPDIMSSSSGDLGPAMITLSPTGTLPALAPLALGLLGTVGVRQLYRRQRRLRRPGRNRPGRGS